MSFDFSSNINPPLKAQSTYKDGGGMGGGGMYMRQQKKKKDEEDDIFVRNEEKDENEINFELEIKFLKNKRTINKIKTNTKEVCNECLAA